MKIEKFKVLLYLKKSGLDKYGKAPIMGRITVNRTMAQFSCKLSCTPSLWNPRASRLEGKSKEAVETNKDIEQLLLSIQKAFDVLVEKRTDFEAKDVKEALQGSVKTQTTLLSFVDEHISELSTHEGIDMSKSSVWTYRKIRKNLAEFIGEKYRLTDLAFGQLTEPFISDFHHYLLDEKGFSSGTITIYVSLFKKMCRIAFERGLCKNLLFAHYRVGTPRVTTPKALSMSDFIKIRDVELPEDKPRLSVSRDMFLFACHAGTAFIDTVSITKANVKVLEDGDKWLVYNRKKTGTLARVKLRGVGADGEIRERGKRYPFSIAEHESCSYRSHHHLQVGGNEQDLFLPFGTTLVRQPHYAGGWCADGDHLQDARSQGCEDDAAVCESDPKEAV